QQPGRRSVASSGGRLRGAQRAAADARAAAEAADRAADHAGQAADAAAEATRHANAATAAAKTAVDAADQAKVVYDAARAADAVRVSTRLDQAREVSAAAAAASPVLSSELTWDMAQVSRRDPQTRQLIAEATAPGVDPQVVADKGRQIALRLVRDGGSWTKEAARTALGGSDELVRGFVTTGIAVAAGRDDRVAADVLTKTGTAGSKAAAHTALSGSDDDVRRFLVERNYSGRDADDRLEINQIMAAARDANRPMTQQEAQRALDAGTSAAYRKFLSKTRYSAAGVDDRVAVGRILNDTPSGSETREMAQIALDGPPGLLRQFLDVDRFNAQRHDQEQAAHNSEVLGYVSKASASAFVALQAANEAQAAAATANDAAEEAAEYARQAGVSAGKAAEEARKASEAADAAARSAEAAANSARTAMNAAASAQQSARSAARSAEWASSSAQQASESAVRAYQSAKVAYETATAAGKSAKEASNDAQRAIDAYVEDQFLYGQMHDKYCQTRFSNDPERRTECSNLLTATADELTEKAYLRSYACRVLDQRPGGQGWDSCLSSVLSPDFEDQQILTVFTGVLTTVAAMQAAAITGAVIFRVGAMCLMASPCRAGLRFLGAALNYIGPEGAAFTPWISTAAGGFMAVQNSAVAREILMNTRSIASRLANAVRRLLGKAPEDLPIGCINSFSGNTEVLMGDGSAKRISDVRRGDVVKSANPVSGTVDTAAVNGMYSHAGRKEVVDVRLVAGGSVEATADHPFWVTEMRDWVRARDLKAGQHLRTDEGLSVTVSGVRPRTDSLRVFNLDVSAPDTYFVLVGGRPVLTHNANCWLAHIALGVDKGGDLVRFAERIGADHLMGDRTGWWDTFLTLVDLMRKNPAWAKISFKLDGLAGAERGALAVVEEALKVAAEIRKTGQIPDGAPFYTIWEIESLVNAKLLRYLDFYYNGVKVPNPWA
ncbi:polymorphic toxin-type HINT domain-containing protein, partial [Lentzea sp. NPDC006480]|uniref:polymorphic toxin-type HINT domain-containing protein n=1 Tax=Lentzea sp. NPDC006480 TaxID=3157176 RepID=UPI0033A8888C